MATATKLVPKRKAKTHEVHVVYREYGKDQGLDVQNYPPDNLQEGDKIVFIPDEDGEEDGELELTFEWGSNFTLLDDDEIVGKSETVRGNVLRKVVRKMTQQELDVLKILATNWSAAKRDELKLNAFPFRCKLTPANDPEHPQAKPPYTGGFPRPPRK